MNRSLYKLFTSKTPYSEVDHQELFLQAMKNSIEMQIDENTFYRRLCEKSGFSCDMLATIQDIEKIPVIPTLFFKRNQIGIRRKHSIEVTSSGTSGNVSRVSYQLKDLYLLAKMAVRLGKLHGLFSLYPTHYIILGYQPTRKNKTVISKTAFLSTLYAPGIQRMYALIYNKGNYQLNLEYLILKIEQYAKKSIPVRVIGFPSYVYFLLQKMEQENRICFLPKGSKVLFGGGWKQFSKEEISKEMLYRLVNKILGIKTEHIHEFFSAAEHPILYCSCKNHHFHIPAYAKVIIRDVSTLQPLQKGQAGLLNLLTPINASLPLASILTDDYGIMHDASDCGCGIKTDYFEILGRVGVEDIKTCSAGAKEYLTDN